jgi:hypothetical protein
MANALEDRSAFGSAMANALEDRSAFQRQNHETYNSNAFHCLQVPEEAYEFNFVLHDNEGTYENNAGQDFYYPVAEGSTPERWSEILAERVAMKEAQRAVSGVWMGPQTLTFTHIHAYAGSLSHTAHGWKN